jgi:hypothetical protein
MHFVAFALPVKAQFQGLRRSAEGQPNLCCSNFDKRWPPRLGDQRAAG